MSNLGNFASPKPPLANKKSQQQIKLPSNDLMERLAGGKKGNVDKKEMRSMTRRNYANLPEIKKKKDEEKMKADLA